ncbi:unnamed protein product [Diabrotica balteata]|uniref:Uncharacterized protein n=1 Tax=Diabrotica balteata TaxID=107213 RepID=A0A9N9STY9_DIABA|nr:unnamed protein product [Diabrotica balteata]
MADRENQSSAASATSASGTPQTSSPSKKEKKAKSPRAKPSHSPTSEMVRRKGLKERGDSSLQAIKKLQITK